MSIAPYLKDIARGRDGARALDRTAAADLMGRILDGELSELELGAFCVAMRIKGETAAELCGFLDALHERIPCIPVADVPTVVLPCYNGARRLPALTPLLALLLARQGLRVVMHGQRTVPQRTTSFAVLWALAQRYRDMPITFCSSVRDMPSTAGVGWLDTATLSPGLQHLLDVRHTTGLRNSGHSIAKMLNPAASDAILVTCYTHPEYHISMTAALCEYGQRAMLLRGTEGEPVADPRRTPELEWVEAQRSIVLERRQEGSLSVLPTLGGIDAQATADAVAAMLTGQQPIPSPILCQLRHLCMQCSRHLCPPSASERSHETWITTNA